MNDPDASRDDPSPVPLPGAAPGATGPGLPPGRIEPRLLRLERIVDRESSPADVDAYAAELQQSPALLGELVGALRDDAVLRVALSARLAAADLVELPDAATPARPARGIPGGGPSAAGDTLPGARRPERPMRVLLRWSGWAAAAALAVALGLSQHGPAPAGAPPGVGPAPGGPVAATPPAPDGRLAPGDGGLRADSQPTGPRLRDPADADGGGLAAGPPDGGRGGLFPAPRESLPGGGALATALPTASPAGHVVGELPLQLVEARPVAGADGQLEVLYVRPVLERVRIDSVYELGHDESGVPAPVPVDLARLVATDSL